MESKTVKLKLVSHQKNYRDEDLLVSVKLKDLGLNVKEKDIIEIYHPEEDEHQPRLLLQISHFEDDGNVQKDTISVEQNIACTFQLRVYKDVIVNKVDPKAVSLELLELTFKDQYLGRSEMWRLKRSLVNTVAYLKKNIEYCSSLIRCQVYEMWAQGEKVACGVVSEDTKVVFRSSTCQAYLFIQMSSEMWEFDLYGDLYFEKTVNGFLAELFAKWKKEGSNHDVTIVLFSRTFYKASSIEEFPVYMRECLQEDYQGRFYEDFYRVAIQNDRYDDWMPILSHLRFLFHNYLEDVLEHHKKPGYHVPEAYNSNAPQGNFLEVLNISLNVFEKHYLDRSFERTGQMSVVITPGVGVFEVDRELTNITKQRIIDNGVGSDLVCVGEQPLHAVPLLKFHKKRGSLKADDYSMPHTWINLSFYSSNKRVPGYSTFIPRIKVPQEILKLVSTKKPLMPTLSNLKPLVDDSLPNSMFDYDAYDAQVFKVPTNHSSRTYRSLQRTPARKKTTSHSSAQPPPRVNFPRKHSDPNLYGTEDAGMSTSLSVITGVNAMSSSILGKSPAINIPSRISENKICSHSFGALNVEGVAEKRIVANSEYEDVSSSYVSKIGSSGANSPNEFQQLTMGKLPLRPGRSLINPFDPSHVTIKLTSNRRRWIHTFPKGPTGNLIQPHHYQVSSANLSDEEDLIERLLGEDEPRRMRTTSDHKSQDSLTIDEPAPSVPLQVNRPRTLSATAGTPASSSTASTKGTNSPQKTGALSQGILPSPMPNVGVAQNPFAAAATSKHESLIWGATGEQEWNAEITTGVDWKSLTLPACLPLTTDYFPDKQSLHYDYEVAANYSRVPDIIDDMFLELVSQRLTQGFQLIMLPDETLISESAKNSLVRSRASRQEDLIKEFKLSIGRVYHRVQWKDSSIDVTIYRPKHPYAQLERRYKYLFRSPYLSGYEVSSAEFRTERLENYKWNYLDNYVCFKGDPRECKLLEDFKYWRVRLMILPDLFKQETKRLMEPSNISPCDIYHALSLEEQQATIESFLRFLEVIHRIKRPNSAKRSRGGATGMRECLGNSRITDRPRHISGNKVQDKSRRESGNKEDSTGRNQQTDCFEEEAKEESGLKISTSTSAIEVVEAMKDPTSGIPCIGQQPGLPLYTFIAADATFWVLKHIEEIDTEAAAVEFLQGLLKENFIKHISERVQQFTHGFYLYFLVTGNKEHDHVSVDQTLLENEWHEVAIDAFDCKKIITNSNPCMMPYPAFFHKELPQNKHPSTSHNSNIPSSMYQSGYGEIDIANKSERHEWGHLKYQTKYSPLRCYELILQWLCATGTVVSDLIATWQRKATHLNLHLFPVPNDPFAPPFSTNSNPLRRPIFIPLNIDCLKENGRDIFSEFDPDSRAHRLHLFQESILERFGFMSYSSVMDSEFQSHFIHVTGNIIVLINNAVTSAASVTKGEEQEAHRHCEHKNLGLFSFRDPRPCFLWTFNYMLTKRWKSSISGDEVLGERILKDFKEFCANHSQRLQDYWDSFVLPFTGSPTSPSPFVDVDMQ